MSYNLLSGSVKFEGVTQGTIEDMVDTHSDQTVSGQKTISDLSGATAHITSRVQVGNTHATDHAVNVTGDISASINISASAFYANGVLVNPAGGGISFDGSTANGVLTFKDSDEATVESKLKFDGSVLDFTDTSISGSGNISGSQFYGAWAGSNILGSQVQKASAGGIGDDSGLTLTTTGVAAQNTPGGSVTLFIDDGGTIKKSTLTQLLTNQSVTDASALGNAGRVLLDGGVGTLTSNANLSFGGTPNTLTVTGEISASSDVDIGGTLRVDNHISASTITLASVLKNQGDEDTGLSFDTNKVDLTAAGSTMFTVDGNISPKETTVKNGHFKVDTSGLDLMVSSSTGFVGIGTQSPVAALEISSSNDPQFKITYHGSNAATFKVASDGDLTIDPNGSTTIGSSLTVNGNASFGSDSAATFTLLGSSVTCNNGLNFDSNTLFISSSNNRVGIGTTTPGAPLEVSGANAQLKLSFNAGDNATIGVDDNGHLTFTPSGGKTIVKNDLIIQDDVSTDTVVQIFDSSDDGVIAGYANNTKKTTIHANGTTFFNGGNVAIGGEAAAYALSVSGSFQASGSEVTTRFDDTRLIVSASAVVGGGAGTLFEINSPSNPFILAATEGGVLASNHIPAAFDANLYVSGAVVLGAPTAVVPDANLHSGSVSFYLDEAQNKLKFKIRYSNGTLKNGEINLT